MFKNPVIVFNGDHITKKYYTFKKDGKWCGCDGSRIVLYVPVILSSDINYLIERAYSEGELDGQFEDEDMHIQNGDFRP